MERPSRRASTLTSKWRYLIILVSYIIWNDNACLAQDSSNGFADVRSGRIPLRKASDAATDAVSGNTGSDVASTVPYGKDKSNRQLFVLQYNEANVWQLRTALLAGGTDILEYVADNTLLVQAKPNIISTADRFGALAAVYRPSFKVAPEAAAVFAAAAAAAASAGAAARAQRPAQGRRRGRQLAAPAAGGGSSALYNSPRGAFARLDDDSANASTSSPAAASEPGPFASLSTWRNHLAATQPGDTSSSPPSASKPPPSGSSGSGEGGGSSTSSTGTAAAASSEQDMYGASVRLVPGLSAGARDAIAEAWPAALAAALGLAAPGEPCRPRALTNALYNDMSPILVLYFCPKDYEPGVTWISKMGTVLWIEPALKATVRNSIAGWIMQTGNVTLTQYGNPTATLRPYWAARLQGQGIVVGLDDTGIDMDHCHFIDDRYRQGSLRAMFVGSPPRLYLPDHRKIVQYMLPISSGINRWFGDDPYGHGTHTAGSVAGAAYSNSSASGLVNQRGTGSAPQARLSFFDLAPVGGNLYLPQPLDDKVLSYHYAVGARITSSSWGFTGALAVTYNEICRQYDSFAWRNPDFLSVMAAGNDGDNGNMPTVTAPATAKNVLSVGATVNHPNNFPASQYNLAILFRYTDANGTMQSQSMYPYRGTSEFTWRSMLNSKQVPFGVASPLTACANLTGNYTGMIVLVDLLGSNSTCTADVRASNALARGALAVLFIASTAEFLDNVEVPYIGDFRITWGMITRTQGLAVASLLTNTTRNITRPHMTFLTYPNINLGIDSVTWFSSYGPLPDGRFKPDIVAPGGPVESSLSTGGIGADTTGTTCSSATIQYQGTSMATPLVAGHLALIRQYFRDGFYPLGSPTDLAAVGFEPSGMLLKAAAVAGATSLTGGFAANLGAPLGVAPDGYQGWGRLDLSKTLPLPGQTHPLFRITVADFGVIDQSQWIYLSGIKATGTGPVVAALVWHDYPGSGAAKKGLINDLDFGVQINTSTITRTRSDSVNNVERIELRNLNAGDRLMFTVFGKSVRHKLFTTTDAQLPQRWAVLVAGHFTGTLRTPLNPAYSRPPRFVAATQITIRAPNGCVTPGSTNDTVWANGSCNNTRSFFTLVEEPAPPTPTDSAIAGPPLVSDPGYLYTIRDSLGRCLMLPDGAFGNRVVLAACNATDPFQKFGLYKIPSVAGSYYQLVVSSAIRATAASAGRCLKQTAISALLLWSCDDDDVTQQFELRSATAGQAGRNIAPSPPPPAPSPQAPAQQWYPYSLTFRVDWYPLGVSNLNDYDYQEGHNGYGDEYYGQSLDDLDIILAWSWNGTSYLIGPNSDNTTVAVTGAVYGGDNKQYGTQYEIVYFQQAVTPPPTAFHVCVVWRYTQTPAVRADMTVFRGYAVFTASKTFNTSVTADSTCGPSSGGFVGAFNPTSPPSPPSPPRPPSPPPVPFPLMFRIDWTIVSGMRGRPTKPYDMDIAVSWTVGTNTFTVGSTSYSAGGGLYGGDNLRNNGSSFETVYWPVGASLPSTNTFHACVRWTGNPKPMVQVTLSVFQSGRVTTSSKMFDTTLDWSDACVPGAIGYIDSYWVRGPMGLPTDSSYSTCSGPPAPSPAFSLYFLAIWMPANTTAGLTSLIDWDLVVSWRSGGQSYELSPYSRFASGAVHSGDNMRLAAQGNREAVYWPTGLTGVEPNSAQYDVCVRFFAAGRFNVTLTAYRYNLTVMVVTRTLDGAAINSKSCTPQSTGYLGSYTFATGPVATAFPGRRALELPGEEDGVAVLAASELSDTEQLAGLLP